MNAVIYQNYGAPQVLQYTTQAQKPIIKDDDVLIKIYAADVTAGDLKLRQAKPWPARLYNGLLKPKNQILGGALAGIIEAVGKNVKHLRTGDKVFAFTTFGAYAEYITMPANGTISLMPANICFEEAASIPFGALTALHFLKTANIGKGQRVLVNGAAGNVGSHTVQIAKYYGAVVTGVCRSKQAQKVLSLGADAVIDFTTTNFINDSQTYDIIFDTVGNLTPSMCEKVLSLKGVFVAVAFSPAVMIQSILKPKKVVFGITKETAENLAFIKTLIEDGHLKPCVDKVFPIQETAAAHTYAESGQKTGNVVITMQS